MVGSTVGGLLAAFDAVVDGLGVADFGAFPAAEVAQLVSGLETRKRRLEAVEVRLISALSVAATPAEFGATSVPDLIGGLTRVTRSEARARAQRAVDLAPRRSLAGEALEPIHPRTADALAAGEISGAHADVITRYLGRIPPASSIEAFSVCEAFLVEAARHEDPATLRRSGELMLARLDPDGVEPRDEEQDRQRSFGIGRRGDPNGVYGSFTDENKAVWQAILDSLAAPQPGPDGEADPRTATQRHHDAMLEAGLRLLRSGELPDCGGVPVSVVVRVDADNLATTTRGQAGGIAQTAHGDVVSVHRFLSLADQADVTTVVLTASGEILDYGRTRRCASPGQRRALAARDGGCCFPGCTRPAAWTEAHHIRAWIRGGTTSLDNLCLLCPFHHRTFEAADWTVEMTDGIPQWIPPTWLDPQRRPRRNTAHHLPEINFAM